MPATWMLAPVLAASVAASPPPEKSFPLAVGLTYGVPAACGLTGMLLTTALGESDLRYSLGPAIGLACVATLASGYVYAGDPGRGALVTLGDFGVMTGAMLVSGGVAVAITGGGQQAGFLLPLVGIPVVATSLVGYECWKMWDLKQVIERKNAEARKP
jgi:hypothetical protein